VISIDSQDGGICQKANDPRDLIVFTAFPKCKDADANADGTDGGHNPQIRETPKRAVASGPLEKESASGTGESSDSSCQRDAVCSRSGIQIRFH
jgi:hypothetical protein